MATVTVDELKCIMPNTTLSDAELTCFIDDAICWIASFDESIADSCGECVEDRVAKYLAAHLASSSADRQQIETQTLDAKDKYSDSFKDGLGMTSYGQTAMRMDCTNQLSNEDVKVEKIVPNFTFSAVSISGC